MDSQSTYDDLPWEWIVSALQGELSPADHRSFEEWLAAAPRNREIYQRLQQVWKEGMADYDLYQAADENQSWRNLQQQMAPVIPIRPMHKGRWIAIAATVLLISGAAIWYSTSIKNSTRYETAAEPQTVMLTDGSTIHLQPHTRLQLAAGYNKTGRTVTLLDGEASFDVPHQPDQPFTVDLDAATVKDIGTSFTIHRSVDSITVLVSIGKVTFTKKETGDTRELSAGSRLCLFTGTQRHGEIITTTDPNRLHFDNTPLSDVITALQEQFGKKIRLKDTTFAPRRLTAHLEGETLEDAIKTICASFDLVATSDNEGYLLAGRDSTRKN